MSRPAAAPTQTVSVASFVPELTGVIRISQVYSSYLARGRISEFKSYEPSHQIDATDVGPGHTFERACLRSWYLLLGSARLFALELRRGGVAAVATSRAHWRSRSNVAGRPRRPLFGEACTRTRAKRDRNRSFVPSRQVIVRQACFGRVSASCLTVRRGFGPAPLDASRTMRFAITAATYLSSRALMPVRNAEFEP